MQAGDPLKRNENDKAALLAKVQAKKEAMEAAVTAPSISNGPVPRKKVDKKKESLDDLLSAGLSGNKKKAARAT